MKSISILTLIALVTLSTAEVCAQKSTERYIPIGKSPGLSGKHTSVGTVGAIDTRRGTLTCTDSYGTITVKVDGQTRIWVDRSKQKLMNLQGSLSECKKGSIVEVKFRNNERREGAVADWIKVEAAGSGESPTKNN